MPNQIKETLKTNQISMQSQENVHSAREKELTGIVWLVDLSSDWFIKQRAHSGLKTICFQQFWQRSKRCHGFVFDKGLFSMCVYVCVSSVSSSDSMLFF